MAGIWPKMAQVCVWMSARKEKIVRRYVIIEMLGIDLSWAKYNDYKLETFIRYTFINVSLTIYVLV